MKLIKDSFAPWQLGGFALKASPKISFADSRYVVSLAQSLEEIEAALKLRFEVFNLELGEGLESSFRTGRDRDEFDATCHHLIVKEKDTDEVVGTYRLRTLEMSGDENGFYSAAEFDLNNLPAQVIRESVELGRACIAVQHRNRQVLFLLWKGLGLYAIAQKKRYLFGCCSLTSQDQREGIQTLEHLRENGYLHPNFFVGVKQDFQCYSDEPPASAAIVKVPKLFSNYLSIGARVCSPPAIDRRFKTIDFLVIFDICKIDPRTRRLFLDS